MRISDWSSDVCSSDLFADRMENLERDQLLIAEGRVEIEQGEVRLEADRVEVNTETGEAVATGRVVLFDGRDRLVDRKSAVSGKCAYVRVDLGGTRILQKKKITQKLAHCPLNSN